MIILERSTKSIGGLRYHERTKLLIELIEKEKTGSPTELAGRLGVTKRTEYNIIDELRLTLPRIISYNIEKKSYIFSENN
jgi:transcriptional antiterminator